MPRWARRWRRLSAAGTRLRKRAEALLEAAKNEEQALVDQQKTVGQQMANQNDYSVLGALYGLTPDQIDLLQGTGSYAPSYYGGYTGRTREEEILDDGDVQTGTPSQTGVTLTEYQDANGGQTAGQQKPAQSSAASTASNAASNLAQYALMNVYTQAATEPLRAGGADNAQPIVSKSTANKILEILSDAARKTHVGS